MPDHVDLIPPNASLTIEKAHLRLPDFSEPRGFRHPIDVFFRSSALDQGSNAACIVLSGTGGDGAEGLRAVKEAGGLTLAQEPDRAKYDGMPKSTVATGFVAKILLVRGMPAALGDHFERAEGVTDLETTIRIGDSVLRDFMVDLYPYVEDGSVKAVGLILKDITELRRLEKEMRRLTDELRHRVKNTPATKNASVRQMTAPR